MQHAVHEAWREVTRGGARKLDGRMDLVIADVRSQLMAVVEEMEADALAAPVQSASASPPGSPQVSANAGELGGPISSPPANRPATRMNLVARSHSLSCVQVQRSQRLAHTKQLYP